MIFALLGPHLQADAECGLRPCAYTDIIYFIALRALLSTGHERAAHTTSQASHPAAYPIRR
jgi:hypothetical protein